MKTLRLNRVRQPLPPSGLAEITIHFPGPVTQKYTVINQPIPPAPIDAAPRLSTKDTLCVRAHMDTFFDVKFRNRISANSWYRFRVVDTTLLPWDPKPEKMSDFNPQILHKDHYFQQKCRPSFWTIDFETNEPRNSVGTTVLTGYCFEHNCVENNNQIKSQLVVQLAGYYISHKDWVLILSRLKDPVRDVKGSRIAATVFQGECYPRLLAVSAADIHEGNHKCGNGFESISTANLVTSTPKNTSAKSYHAFVRLSPRIRASWDVVTKIAPIFARNSLRTSRRSAKSATTMVSSIDLADARTQTATVSC
jgi:hypothetical protein